MSCGAVTGGVNNVKNGNIIDNTLSDRTFGAVILYQCDPGYIATNGPYRTCQVTGSWTARPWCNESDCTSVTRPQNGIFLVTNDGSTVSFTCSNGYTLTGSQTIQCNGINWSDGFPTCDIVNCGDPGIPSNGQQMGNTFTYASTVLFSCNHGCNVVGSRSIVCLSSGVWSDILPVCNCNGDSTMLFINPLTGSESRTSSEAEVWTSSMTELQISSNTISNSNVFSTPHDKAGAGLSSPSLSLEATVAIAVGIMALIGAGIVILFLIILKRTRTLAAARRDDFDWPPKSPTETTATMTDTNPGPEFIMPPLSNSASSHYFEIYSQEVVYYYALLCYKPVLCLNHIECGYEGFHRNLRRAYNGKF